MFLINMRKVQAILNLLQIKSWSGEESLFTKETKNWTSERFKDRRVLNYLELFIHDTNHILSELLLNI